MRAHWRLWMSALLSLAYGCADEPAASPAQQRYADAGSDSGAEIAMTAKPAAPTDFESDQFLPPEAVAAALSGNAGTAAAAGGDPAFGEADILALEGERLFVLSALAGLVVVDVADPAHLRVLGRYSELRGMPVQLYLRGDTVWILSSAARAIEPGMSNAGASALFALDVSDPAAISEVATFSLPGVIDASQLVGDVLYVASNETPGCRDCTAPAPPSVVTSFSVREAERARQIVQVRFADRPEDWTRSNSMVTTPERLYLVGPQADPAGSVASTIQVVDISAADGSMRLGARQQVSGVVSSPWQLDERDSVLRVISQPGYSQRGAAQLQTFAVRASDRLEPLAQLELPTPSDANLQGVRFAGSRGYAAVSGTLHRLDLSDPAAPALQGSVQTEASLDYFEPQGDRLLVLGRQLNSAQKRLMLFDVAAPEPKLLSQVSYPARPILSLGESAPTTFSLTVVPEKQLILVPSQGFDFGERGACNGSAAGSLVLVGFENDELTLLDSARSASQPRRAILHGEHVLLAGDERVEAYDLRERMPLRMSSGVTILHNVQFVAHLDGDVIARIVQPLDNIQPVLELTSEAQADDPNQRLGALLLRDQLTTDPKQTCELQFRVEAVHAIGSRLHVVFEAFFSENATFRERRSGVLVVDASDPRAPRLAGKSDWNTDAFYPYTRYVQYGYVERPSYVWHGESLLLIESHVGDEPQDKQLRVVDMRDPVVPLTQIVALQPDVYVGMLVEGDTLFVSRYRRLNAPSIKHYVDRVDLSDQAAARVLPAINTPGALLEIDPETGIALGHSWRFPSAPRDAPSCIPGLPSTTDTCRVMQQSLQRFTLEGDVARLRDQLTLPDGEYPLASARARDQVFAVVSGANESTWLLALTTGSAPLSAARVELSSAEIELWGPARLYARDGLALISRGSGLVIAGLEEDGSLRVHSRQRVSSRIRDVSLGETRALLALELGGSAWIEL